MDKKTFIKRLKWNLKPLSEKEIEKSIDYYNELISDKIEEGMTELEAIESLGNPEAIASRIKSEENINSHTHHHHHHYEEIVIDNRGLRWACVPLWIIYGIFIFAVWVAFISLYVTAGSLVITGPIVSIASLVALLHIGFGQFLVVFGTGIFLLGFSLIFMYGIIRLNKLFIKFTNWLYCTIFNIYGHKEKSHHE